MRKLFSALAISVLLTAQAAAQFVGGSASISATSVSSNVAVPSSQAGYPALLIAPAAGPNAEVFYAIGADNTVAATTSSPALPSGGICIPNVGTGAYVAAVTGAGAATVRITQMQSCPGPLGGSPNGSLVAVVGRGVNNLIASAAAGNLHSVYATNQTGTSGFLVVIDSATVPGNGATITPLDCVVLPANGIASINYAPGPAERFSTGITALLTSANVCTTYTTGAITGFMHAMVQ